jgi:hypothetical protein
MSRRSGAVPSPDKQSNATPSNDGSEKQKMLLSTDTGHFSMIRYVPYGPREPVILTRIPQSPPSRRLDHRIERLLRLSVLPTYPFIVILELL